MLASIVSSRRLSFAGNAPIRAAKAMLSGNHGMNFNKALDKVYEGRSIADILKLPTNALQGISPETAVVLGKFKIQTVEDLGNWKPYKIARAVVELSKFEENDKRASNAASNIHDAFDKDYRDLSLESLCALPPHSIKGMAPWVDAELSGLKKSKIRTIKDLGTWKYARIAESLCFLAQFEEAPAPPKH